MKDLDHNVNMDIISPLMLFHPSPNPWGPSGSWLMQQRRLNGALGTGEVKPKLWLLLLQMVSLLDRAGKEQDFIPSCAQLLSEPGQQRQQQMG